MNFKFPYNLFPFKNPSHDTYNCINCIEYFFVSYSGAGANAFAESIGLQQLPVKDLTTDEARRQLLQFNKYTTAVNTLFNKQQ